MINLYSRTVILFFFRFSQNRWRETILDAAKQGGRRNATEKTASDANMIIHLNNGETHQASARLLEPC